MFTMRDEYLPEREARQGYARIPVYLATVMRSDGERAAFAVSALSGREAQRGLRSYLLEEVPHPEVAGRLILRAEILGVTPDPELLTTTLEAFDPTNVRFVEREDGWLPRVEDPVDLSSTQAA